MLKEQKYPAHEKLKRMSANSSYYDGVIDEFTALESKLNIAVEALGFYAKAWKIDVFYSIYPDSRSCDCFEDNGNHAQQALKLINGEEGCQ
jgi:hypothetical protein